MAQADFTRIATNIAALNSVNALRNVNNKLATSQVRLATGLRINEAADDPAGLVIATKFRARSEGLAVAMDNIGDAKNLLAVGEGGLQKIKDILIQIRSKAEQAVSDSLGSDERTAIESQISSYLTEIGDIVDETTWNNTTLIAGSTSILFQTGADAGETTTFTLAAGHKAADLGITLGTTSRDADVISTNSFVTNYGATAPASGEAEMASGTYTVQVRDNDGTAEFRLVDQYGEVVAVNDADGSGTTSAWQLASDVVSTTFDTERGLTITFGATAALGEASVSYTAQGGQVDNSTNATQYLSNVVTALDTVSSSISNVGSLVARLTFKEDNLAVAKVNTEAAYSRIISADMAYEQLEATKMMILQQTALAMLAQANLAPQGVLALFQ